MRSNGGIRPAWGVAFVVAVALMAVGARLDELTMTMMNAILVCLACLGVG